MSKYLVYCHYYHETDDISENLISNQYVEADNPDDATKIAEDTVKEWCNSMRGIYEFTYSEPPILLTPEAVKSMNLNPSILDEADDGYVASPMEQFGTINDLINKRIDDYYEGTYSDESLVTLIQSRLPLIEKIKQQADIETRSYINQVVAEWKDILADLEPAIAQDGPNMDDDDYDDLDDDPDIIPSDMDDI